MSYFTQKTIQKRCWLGRSCWGNVDLSGHRGRNMYCESSTDSSALPVTFGYTLVVLDFGFKFMQKFLNNWPKETLTLIQRLCKWTPYPLLRNMLPWNIISLLLHFTLTNCSGHSCLSPSSPDFNQVFIYSSIDLANRSKY